MLKQKTIFEHKIGDRTYVFECDPTSPLGEIHDSLCIMKNFVIEKIMEIKNNEKKLAEEKKEAEPEIIEVK